MTSSKAIVHTMKSVAACVSVLALGASAAAAATCTQQIKDVERQLAASDAGAGPTKGTPAPTAGDKKGQHPGTSLMSKRTKNRAISPEDVLRQGGVKADASRALQHARKMNAEGNEAACIDAVKSARQRAGL